MTAKARARERIQVVLPQSASAKQHRELGAFARYCINRTERDVIGGEAVWTVQIAPIRGGYTSKVTARRNGVTYVEAGIDNDAALATWNAMCRLEDLLRDNRHAA